jgi:MerR family transcriptional regulator, light-induced transcriptional regulator
MEENFAKTRGVRGVTAEELSWPMSKNCDSMAERLHKKNNPASNRRSKTGRMTLHDSGSVIGMAVSDPHNEPDSPDGVSVNGHDHDNGREPDRSSRGSEDHRTKPDLVLRIPKRARPPLEREQLDLLIQGEIIPRLMMALGTGKAAPEVSDDLIPTINQSTVDDFASLMRRQDTSAADAFVVSLRESGINLDQIYLELMAPAARALGEMWDDDKADFVEVTLALSRLHRMVRATAGEPLGADDTRPLAATNLSVLLAPTPGETHTFGLTLLGEYFRQGGWDTVVDPALSRDKLVTLVRRNTFDVVGLTLAHERLVPELVDTISELRQASARKALVIMVGGAVFANKLVSVADVNADGWAVDARGAVRTATKLVAQISEQRSV